MNKTIIMAILAAAIASGGLATTASTALGQAEKQDGWGEVTSEAATSGGDDFGGHASDPSGDGVGNNDDGDADDDPDTDDDGVEKHDPRVGLGQLAGGNSDGQLDDLGCFLATQDNNPDTAC